MHRILFICTVWLGLPLAMMAQARDPRVDKIEPRMDKVEMETEQLKRTIADQDRRIAELEKTVQALQASANPRPGPIPAPTPAWQLASSWNLIKKGMSEAQVVEILGPPTNAQGVTDMRTLFYQPDSRSTTTLSGSVTLTDDRVTASNPPTF